MAGATPAPGAGGGGPAPEGQAAPGSTCTPEGASDVGIEADSVTLGQVGTISGPIPGLSQTAVNGVRAYIAYRNSQGGVCGRELRLVNGDLLLLVDNMTTSFYESRFRAIAEYVAGGGQQVEFEFSRSERSRKRPPESVYELIGGVPEPERKVYEYRRA